MKTKFKVSYVKMPPEQVAAYWAAIEVLADLLKTENKEKVKK
jgi:hypothetical protein